VIRVGMTPCKKPKTYLK